MLVEESNRKMSSRPSGWFRSIERPLTFGKLHFPLLLLEHVTGLSLLTKLVWNFSVVSFNGGIITFVSSVKVKEINTVDQG